MLESDVVGTGNTKLGRVVAADDARHGDDVVFEKVFHGGHLVDVHRAFTLSDGGVAVGVDGTDDGFHNLHAGGLKHVGSALVVFQNLGNSLLGNGKVVAVGEDDKLVGVAAVDAGKFDKAVIDGFLAIGQNHVASSQGAGNRVVVEIEVDTSSSVLDIHVTSVDEGHHTFHQCVFIVSQGFGLSDGHRANNGVIRRRNLAIDHSFLNGLGLYRSSLADGDGIGVNDAVRSRVGSIHGVIDGGPFGGA